MEDASLDDFFAKKDKTKKKNKSKLTPSDILAQQETGTKKSKKKKDKDNETTAEERKIPNDDENWVDFEQEAEADYSGLRIQNLQIINKEEEEEELELNGNEEDEGEMRQRKDEVSGPWNKSTQPVPTLATAAVPEPPPPEPEVPQEDEPKPRKYVPPGARAASSSSPAVTPSKLAVRKKKTAPNLKSEDDFPTLGGGGAPEVRSWGSNSEYTEDFEKVQSGGRSMEDPNKVNQQLTLGNRYSSLQD